MGGMPVGTHGNDLRPDRIESKPPHSGDPGQEPRKYRPPGLFTPWHPSCSAELDRVLTGSSQSLQSARRRSRYVPGSARTNTPSRKAAG
jgi:hypothetical protein